MTFDARETSIAGGQPIRLYDFQRGVLHWRYTDADRAIDLGALTYEPIAISDDGIRQTGEATADALRVTVPWNAEIARQFRGTPPSAEYNLTIHDTHFGETEVPVAWVGSIVNVQRPSPERAVIVCQPLDASLNRPGLRLGWERNCPYAVYDTDCTVDPTTHRVTVTIVTVTGSTLEAAGFDAFADGHFDGGYVEWDIGSGEQERRGIETHVGSVVTLLGGTEGIDLGMSLRAYPGCDGRIETCHNKFDNKDNHGGHPHLPGKSPFDGTPVF